MLRRAEWRRGRRTARPTAIFTPTAGLPLEGSLVVVVVVVSYGVDRSSSVAARPRRRSRPCRRADDSRAGAGALPPALCPARSCPPPLASCPSPHAALPSLPCFSLLASALPQAAPHRPSCVDVRGQGRVGGGVRARPPCCVGGAARSCAPVGLRRRRLRAVPHPPEGRDHGRDPASRRASGCAVDVYSFAVGCCGRFMVPSLRRDTC